MKNARGAGCRVLGLVGLMFLLHTACFGKEAVDPNAWDFGKIKQGEVATHVFSLKNESGKTLNITALNTSCGCTVSEVKKKVLLAQESTELEVKFNSKGYSGAVQQFVYVNTDDIDKPVIRFIIKAEVVK
ncbi:MAG: DUF1573 domain-containing protein [Candidatus Omnitrophota bacterium]|nr:DUF1573 domain-containing protein [Candidatus Omnitrophota bacterium]